MSGRGALQLRRKASLAAIIGVGLAVGAPFALGGSAVLGSLRDVAPQLFMILAGLSVVSAAAKAGKLQILLLRLGQRPPFLRTLAISLATDFAFLSSPAGAAGYAVNVALLGRAGTSWTAATAVVGAEQALDLVFFAVVTPVAFISASVPLARVVPRIPESVYMALVAATLLAALGLWSGRHLVVATVHSFVRATPWFQARQERIGEFVAELRKQMGTLIEGDTNQNIVLIMLTALQWLTRYGVLWVVLLELGYRLPFEFVWALQAGVLHLAQWTGIPAGGGSADFAFAAALEPWVLSPAMATVLLLWRLATLYVPLIVGALSLAALACNARSCEANDNVRRR